MFLVVITQNKNIKHTFLYFVKQIPSVLIYMSSLYKTNIAKVAVTQNDPLALEQFYTIHIYFSAVVSYTTVTLNTYVF